MINQIPCIYNYISETKKGDRNSNFFKAINHLRQFNREAPIEEITNEALQVNARFQEPLSEHEVGQVCNHVCKTTYYSTCRTFQDYCKHCKYGHNRKPFKETIPNLWRILNKDNTIKNRLFGLPKDAQYYLWDILDTETLSNDDKLRVQKLRENKGINPMIDEVIKLRGFPVGDKARKLFIEYLSGER